MKAKLRDTLVHKTPSLSQRILAKKALHHAPCISGPEFNLYRSTTEAVLPLFTCMTTGHTSTNDLSQAESHPFHFDFLQQLFAYWVLVTSPAAPELEAPV